MVIIDLITVILARPAVHYSRVSELPRRMMRSPLRTRKDSITQIGEKAN